GLARDAETPDAYESAIWGTPYYVAPEKIQRKGEDFLSDMYSLGGTLYHALTGHVPFEATTVEEVIAGHVHTAWTPPNHVDRSITQLASGALRTTMGKQAGERLDSGGERIRDKTEAARETSGRR